MKKLALACVFAALSGQAFAQEARVQTEGIYAGLYTGAAPTSGNVGYAGGLMIGARTSPAENTVVGLELQGGGVASDQIQGETFAIAHGGAVIAGNTLALAEVGYGARYSEGETDKKFLVGLGGELAVNDRVSLRGEAQFLGDTDDFDFQSSTGRLNFGVLGRLN